jgi:hypothetical protein
VSAHEEAQRFLDQLRAQNHAALGTVPARADPALAKDITDRLLRESFTPEQRQNPRLLVEVERVVALSTQSIDDMFSDMLTRSQDDIEKTAAARTEGVDLRPLRPFIGHLQTGQLNAVSMRVPGRSGAYLVLLEDQMVSFASKLSQAVAWAIPHRPTDANGKITFEISMHSVKERIEIDPEVADRFADIVVTYAVTGSLAETDFNDLLPPVYTTFAELLSTSVQYFVLAHEYAHILLGHLDTTPACKGVLPAAEAEALAYSWRQEFDADWLGAVLSINALIEHRNRDVFIGFSGIGLFFDALDVMDRAVALLQTGDENARQLGSHPPSDLRKQRLRSLLPQMAEDDPADAGRVRAALKVTEDQEEIIRLLWEHTRPILLDLRRRGVPASATWRTIPKDTGDMPAPAPQSAPAPKQARRRSWPWGRSG